MNITPVKRFVGNAFESDHKKNTKKKSILRKSRDRAVSEDEITMSYFTIFIGMV